MGALCTLITYVLMTVNLISLISAFQDGSKQDEKISTTYVDRFLTEAYNFDEYNLEIQLLTYPPLDPSIGKIIFQHYVEGEVFRPLQITPCIKLEERIARMDEYWVPRLGENYPKFRESALCLTDD